MILFLLEHVVDDLESYRGSDYNPDQTIAEGIIFTANHVRVEQACDQPENKNCDKSSHYLPLSFFSI